MSPDRAEGMKRIGLRSHSGFHRQRAGGFPKIRGRNRQPHRPFGSFEAAAYCAASTAQGAKGARAEPKEEAFGSKITGIACEKR